jgi:hypothetical protein
VTPEPLAVAYGPTRLRCRRGSQVQHDMNTYSRATLLDVARGVSGLGDLLTRKPNSPHAGQPMPERGATDESASLPRRSVDVHADVHDRPAQGGSEWHSAATLPTSRPAESGALDQ